MRDKENFMLMPANQIAPLFVSKLNATPVKDSKFEGIYFYQHQLGQWVFDIQKAPRPYAFTLETSSENDLQFDLSKAGVTVQQSTHEDETLPSRFGDVLSNHRSVIDIPKGYSGTIEFKLTSLGTMLGIGRVDEETKPDDCETNLEQKACYDSPISIKEMKLGSGKASEDKIISTLTLPPTSSYVQIHWEGARQDGSMPAAGRAEIYAEVENNSGIGYSEIKDISETFEILQGKITTSFSSNQRVLKLDPHLIETDETASNTSALSQIRFDFGIHGRAAHVESGIRTTDAARPVKLYEFSNDILYAPHMSPKRYYFAWDGITSKYQIPESGKSYEFYLIVKDPENENEVVSTYSHIFEIQYTGWIDAAEDESLKQKFNIQIKEAQVFQDRVFVSAKPEYMLSGRIEAELPFADKITYAPSYVGTQKIISYKPERFSLLVQRKRKSFQVKVWSMITQSGGRVGKPVACGFDSKGRDNSAMHTLDSKTVTFEKGGAVDIDLLLSPGNRNVFGHNWYRGDDRKGEVNTPTQLSILIFDPNEDLKDLTYDNFLTYMNDKSDPVWYKGTINLNKHKPNDVVYWKKSQTTCPRKPGRDEAVCDDKTDTDYKPHQNMLSVTLLNHPDANGTIDHFRWNHGAFCDNRGHKSTGIRLRLNVLDNYWNSPFGYNNYATKSLRFDPTNKSLFKLNTYFFHDDYDNNLDGVIDRVTGGSEASEIFGYVTPFDTISYRITPFRGSEPHVVKNNLTFNKEHGYPIREETLNPDELTFQFAGDEKQSNNSPKFIARIHTAVCEKDVKVKHSGVSFRFDPNDLDECGREHIVPSLTKTITNNDLHRYPLKPFEPVLRERISPGLARVQYSNLYFDVSGMTSVASLQTTESRNLEMKWPLTLSEFDLKQKGLINQCGTDPDKWSSDIFRFSNCQRIYKGVSGTRFGFKDGMEGWTDFFQYIPKTEGQAFLNNSINPSQLPPQANLTSFGSGLVGTKTGNYAINPKTSKYEYLDGIAMSKIELRADYQSNFGRFVTVNPSASKVTFPHYPTSKPKWLKYDVNHPDGLHFYQDELNSWKSAADPNLMNRDLDFDGLTDEDGSHAQQAFFNDDGTDASIDEDPVGFMVTRLGGGQHGMRYIPDPENKVVSLDLLDDIYLHSNPSMTSNGLSLFKKDGKGWTANPLLQNIQLKEVGIRYPNGELHEDFEILGLNQTPYTNGLGDLILNKSADLVQLKVSRKPGVSWNRKKEFITIKGRLPATGKEKIPYSVVYIDRNKNFVKAFSGFYSDNAMTENAVLGYVNVNKIQGSTSFYLLFESGVHTYFKKLDAEVGHPFDADDINGDQVISSLYGDVEISFPEGAYDKTTPITVRTSTVSELGISRGANLSTIGPIIETLPSSKFISGKEPQVSFKLYPSDLSGLDIASIKIYKIPEPEKDYLVNGKPISKERSTGLEELEHITYIYYRLNGSEETEICSFESGEADCIGGQQQWDHIKIMGKSKAFSLFGLMMGNETEQRAYTFDVAPLVGITSSRTFKIDGLDKNSFKLFADDDNVWEDANDITQPIEVTLSINDAESNQTHTEGQLQIPVALIGKELTIFVVPNKSNALIHSQNVQWIVDNFTFSYQGTTDVAWLGTSNGYLSLPYQSSHPGDIELIIMQEGEFFGSSLFKMVPGYQTIRWTGREHGVQLESGEYQLTLSATSESGKQIQDIGPTFKFDNERPSGNISGTLVYDEGDVDIQLVYSAYDGLSGIANTKLTVKYGHHLIAEENLGSTLNGGRIIPLTKADIESCLGCYIIAEFKVTDKGQNFSSTFWQSEAIYPLPSGLIYWYSFSENSGTVAHDFTTEGNHLGLEMTNPWYSPSGITFETASDIAQSKNHQHPDGIEDKCTIEWWQRGRSTSGVKKLFSWKPAIAAPGFTNFSVSEGGDKLTVQIDNSESLEFTVQGSATAWSHYVLVLEDMSVRLYLNGKLISNKALNTPFQAEAEGRIIVGDEQKTNSFKGILGLLRIWNKALSQDEATGLYTYKEDETSDVMTVQAEEMAIVSGEKNIEFDCRIFSGRFLELKNQSIAFTLNAEADGEYYLFARAFSQHANVLSVNVNGTRIENWRIPRETRWSQYWLTVSNISAKPPEPFHLNKGANRIEISVAGALKLDWVGITANPLTNIQRFEPEVSQTINSMVTVAGFDNKGTDQKWVAPVLFIKNVSDNVLNDVRIRYYVKEAAQNTLNARAFYPSNMDIRVQQVNEKISYVEATLTGLSLKPGETLNDRSGVKFGLHRSDWGMLNKEDDPSYMGTQSEAIPQNNIAVFDLDGNVISDWSCFDFDAPEIGTEELVVLAKDITGDKLNASKVRFYVENTGTLPMTNFEVRYYFSAKEAVNPEAEVYYSPEAVHQLNHVREDDYYISFKYRQVLNPGEKTEWGSGALFEIHYPSWQTLWNDNDDPSHQGLTSSFSEAKGMVILNANGDVLYGKVPVVSDNNEVILLNSILNFDDLENWASNDGNINLSSSKKVEGEGALQFAEKGGWFILESQPALLDPKNLNAKKLGLQLYIPSANQNPFWIGTFEATLSIEGYYDIHLDQLDLTGSNLDAWNLLEFDLPNEFLQALTDQNRRVSITFILNTSDNVGPYFLDNAIFK